VKIRSATSADIHSILSLERKSVTAAHWTQTQYRQALEGEGQSQSQSQSQRRLLLVAHDSSSISSGLEISAGAGTDIVGFLVAVHLAPDWELENIVVAPSARRNGLGQRLLDACLAAARETNSASVFLEVRESNGAARSLYEKAGFEQIGRRKSYYSNPSEDAILYRFNLG
jgi:ribosomal-protein-alanine N-acetyltransferase